MTHLKTAGLTRSFLSREPQQRYPGQGIDRQYKLVFIELGSEPLIVAVSPTVSSLTDGHFLWGLPSVEDAIKTRCNASLSSHFLVP